MALEEYVKRANGKHFVIGVDKFSDEDYWQGSYSTPEEALKVARENTTNAMGLASHADVATVYYAYTPQGKYLGGDTWKDLNNKNSLLGL